MNSIPSNSSSAFLAIFWGGLACGVFDITQAMIAFYLQAGVTPVRVLQSVASGLLGKSSFQGGTKTAILGAFLHFFIAFSWAAIFYVVSRRVTFLTEKAGDVRFALWRICLADDDFRGVAAFGDPSLARLECRVDYHRSR